MSLRKNMTKKLDALFTSHQHYYIREKGNVPLATVAVGITKDGESCRGIAICSCDEPFSKEEGAKRAYRRLLAAAHRKSNDLPINDNLPIARPSVFRIVFYHMNPDIELYKSAYDVTLTAEEANILDSRIAVSA